MFWILIHWVQIRIQHFRQNTIPDPDPGFWWLNFEKNLDFIFLIKIAIYLYLGHHKGRPSYMRSLQPSTENIQPFKTEKGIRIRNWIRIRKSVVRIWVSVSVPKCHNSTTTLAWGMLLRILSRIRSRIRILIRICKSVARIRGSGFWIRTKMSRIYNTLALGMLIWIQLQ